MASVSNRVYPLKEFPEIVTSNLRVLSISGSAIIATGSITGSTLTTGKIIAANVDSVGLVSGSKFIFRTTNTSIPSSSMSPGEIIFFTGAGTVGVTGTNLFYVCVPSGSKNAIYVLSGSFVSAAIA